MISIAEEVCVLIFNPLVRVQRNSGCGAGLQPAAAFQSASPSYHNAFG
jgi:hypothetical protein